MLVAEWGPQTIALIEGIEPPPDGDGEEEPWWEKYKVAIVIACIAIIGLSLAMGRK